MTVGKQERDVTDNKMLSVIPVAGYGVITPPLHLFHAGNRMPLLLWQPFCCLSLIY